MFIYVNFLEMQINRSRLRWAGGAGVGEHYNKGHEEDLRGDGYIPKLDYDGGFTCVNIMSTLIKIHAINYVVFISQLYFRRLLKYIKQCTGTK